MVKTAPRFPGPNDRTFITGRTGSGKTQAAAWHLSYADFHVKPWVILDWKGDKLLGQIERARVIEPGEIPKHPGIYIARPTPDDERVEPMLMSIWERENMGLYIDEGYMISQRSAGLRSIVTQGRSKHIPVIVLSQQPVWVSSFAISEADFFQVFNLSNTMHHKVIRQFMPIEDFQPLEKYHSYYYDVAEDDLRVLAPVEDSELILDRFDRRLKKTSLRRAI